MSRRTSLVFVLFLSLAALIAAGCGGGDDEGSSSDTATTETSGGAEPEGGSVALAADPGGGLAFDKTELEAPAGAVVIDFTNDSSNPHNVTIEGNGIEEVASDTITGDSTSVTAELEPGTYTFYCSVGAHRAGGMEGILTVN